MRSSTGRIGLWTRLALVIAVGAAGLVLSAGRAQASRQALFSDGHGGNYCDDTCSGSGCCPDRYTLSQ